MKLRIFQFCRARRSAFIAICGFLAATALMIAGVTSAQQPDSRTRQTGTATPTPTPAQTGPGRRIAPQLGAPPPPPVLKPKPTPTPDPNSAEIDPESRITINTDLVTLHVRVIDRNNHPINRLAKDDFRILE